MTLTPMLGLLAFFFCSAEVRPRQASGGAVAKREAKAKPRDAGTIKPAPQPAFNLQKEQGYKHAPAADPVVEKPAKSIQEEFLDKQDEPRKERSPRQRGDRVVLHGAIGEKGQPNAVIVDDGTEASQAVVSAESHNRDQGGKPEDPKAKGKDKGR